MSPARPQRFAPGMNVLIRDEAWRVLRVDRTSTDNDALHVVGLTELVRDKEALFSTEFDKEIEILDPVETTLVQDESSHYHRAMLTLESLLRQTSPTDASLYVGPRAALDVMRYQMKPASMALSQPRQRILIADAVGLGKTLEAGILLSELIARGRAKRILVVALKSLLTQFQKEMWSRFTIPLVRLDSTGLQKIRREIPVNHNPFYMFDKSIISIDTLKQNNEYRRYLEEARWDVIVIDEAHNVARRGSGRSRSLRNRLAELLSTRSDTLIMLSATPHDGKAQTFASLMNMLDPTAIADEQKYTRDDIKQLYVRRFKKDVAAELGERIPPRQIEEVRATASAAEERAYDAFAALTFTVLDQRRSGGNALFKTTVEKALLSSPAACLETIHSRVKTMKQPKHAGRYADDIDRLEAFAALLDAIDAASFSKYQRLLEHLDGYTPAPSDRLVIFTERIATMQWLAEHLSGDLGLTLGESVRTLHGGMSDTEQQEVIEAFGKRRDPVRVLVASDVASEGVNLHYQCHRMVHFDIPWSLMVFQQRNGRIDRYGQEHQPLITYLLTDTDNPKLSGDRRILEILIKKDEQVQLNIGDPSALTGATSPEEEERITAHAVEQSDPDWLEHGLGGGLDIDLSDLLDLDDDGEDEADVPDLGLGGDDGDLNVHVIEELPSLYADDFAFLTAALRAMEHPGVEIDEEARRVVLEVTPDLGRRFKSLPQELELTSGRVILTANVGRMKEAIKEARAEESAWPSAHFLWRLHPIFRWVQDKFSTAFGRHSAPVLHLDAGLEPDEQVVLLSGLIPNRKSQPVLHRWFAASFRGGRFDRLEPFEAFQKRTGLGARKLPNRGEQVDCEALREALLPTAVKAVEEKMRSLREEHERAVRPKLDARMAELRGLKERKLEVQQELFERHPERKAQAERRIEAVFEEYGEWVEDTMRTEAQAFVQVVAVMCASAS